MDFRDSIIEAAVTGLKTAVKEAASISAKAQLGEFAANVFSESAAAAVSPLASALLRSLLNSSNSINTKLDTIIGEPLNTGCRIALEAMDTKPENDDERKFWQDRFRLAIEHLERARTYTLAGKNAQPKQLYIDLLEGLCALHIPGGRAYSTPRLTAAAQAFQKQANTITPFSTKIFYNIGCAIIRNRNRFLPPRIASHHVFRIVDGAGRTIASSIERSFNWLHKRRIDRASQLTEISNALRNMASPCFSEPLREKSVV